MPAQVLTCRLVEAQLLVERTRAEYLTAGAAAREAAGADIATMRSQLEAADEAAAVQRVVADAWVRDVKVRAVCIRLWADAEGSCVGDNPS